MELEGSLACSQEPAISEVTERFPVFSDACSTSDIIMI
jgi:hypothetical protein